MIVVVGHPYVTVANGGHQPAGTTALAAVAAARSGATVQLVGKVGDDPAGDDLLLALARERVGHVALLRDPSRPTPLLRPHIPTDDLDTGEEPSAALLEPADPSVRPALEAADVDLGLRYLTDFRAVILAEPLPDAVVAVAAEATRYAGAQLVVVAAPPDDRSGASRPLASLPDDAVVLGGPPLGGDEGFALLLGQVAAAIDAGSSAADALGEATRRLGATPAEV